MWVIANTLPLSKSDKPAGINHRMQAAHVARGNASGPAGLYGERQMDSGLLTTLVILVAAIVLFISERVSIDLVALLVLVALGLSRVLTPAEVFSGLSDTSVITIMSIFVLAHGLEVTGVAERVGDLLMRMAGKSETRLIVAIMTTSALMSLFMNNIDVATVLLPAT